MAGTLERQRDVYKEVTDMDWKEVVICAQKETVKKQLNFVKTMNVLIVQFISMTLNIEQSMINVVNLSLVWII